MGWPIDRSSYYLKKNQSYKLWIALCVCVCVCVSIYIYIYILHECCSLFYCCVHVAVVLEVYCREQKYGKLVNVEGWGWGREWEGEGERKEL